VSEYKVRVNNKEYLVKIVGDRGNVIDVEVEGTRLSVSFEEAPSTTRTEAPAREAAAPVPQIQQKPESPAPATAQALTAPQPVQAQPVPQPSAVGGAVVTSKVPGKVKEVKVSEGQQVSSGQPVVIIESMKMDIEIRANKTGTVKAVYVKPGQFVQKDAPLILIE